jgi:chemotaxis protein MotB
MTSTLENAIVNRSALRRLGPAALLSTLGLFGLGLGGCAGSNSALLDANRALQDRNTELAQRADSLTRLNQELQRALQERDGLLSQANMTINDLRSGSGGAQARIDELNRRIAELGQFGDINIALDPETDKLLEQLAQQYPDLLEYDRVRGMIRFKSDLTFDSGSDVVRSGAKPSLQALAGILTGAAAQYDVRVVGHTDSQRLSAGTAARHTSNIRLSADRAISVRNELSNAGVDRNRIEIGGWGEFSPRVPNNPNGNTAENRRVEIFLVRPMGSRIPVNAAPEGSLPPRGSAPARSGGATTPARPATPPPAEEIMK